LSKQFYFLIFVEYKIIEFNSTLTKQLNVKIANEIYLHFKYTCRKFPCSLTTGPKIDEKQLENAKDGKTFRKPRQMYKSSKKKLLLERRDV